MAAAPTRVLLVEDNPGDARLVELALGQEVPGRFVLERVDRIAEAEIRLRTAAFEAVLLDMNLPDGSGVAAFAAIRAAAPDVAIIVLSGMEDPVLVTATLSAGAQAFRVKGTFPRGYLGRTLESAVARQRLSDRWADDPGAADRALETLDGMDEASALVTSGAPVRTTRRFAALNTADPSGATPLDAALAAIPPGTRFAIAPWTGPPPYGTAPADVQLRALGPDPPVAWLVTVTAPGGPAPAGPPADDPIDGAAWSEVVDLAGGSGGFLGELVTSFLDESGNQLSELVDARERGDAAGVAAAAHVLKSACAQVAALRLSRTFAAMEQSAIAGAVPEPTAVTAVRAAYRDVVDALRGRVGLGR